VRISHDITTTFDVTVLDICIENKKMKGIPSAIISLTFLLLLCFSSNAQILSSKALIIGDLKEYSTGIDNKGNEHITYDEKIPGINGGSITRTTVLYFLKSKDKLKICSHAKIINPSTEAPIYIAWLDEKMEKLGENRWKDLETNYIYKVQTIEPFFAMTIWKDGDGVTELFGYK